MGDLFSLVVLAGGLAIWLELALRAASVELAIFFMPLAFAGLVWPATAHWAKRLLHVLGALLFAKPVIVAALCLGDNALTSTKAGPSSLVTGAAILLMAAFAPMVLLKLVPMVEVSAIAHLQGVSRQPFHAAERSYRPRHGRRRPGCRYPHCRLSRPAAARQRQSTVGPGEP